MPSAFFTIESPVHAVRSILASIGIATLTATSVQAQFITTDFPRSPRPTEETALQDHDFVGMWASEDGHIRHELLSNGRYNEARGAREHAYQGRYRVTGDIIQYWDDTGFHADGKFRDGVLHHGGYVFHPAHRE